MRANTRIVEVRGAALDFHGTTGLPRRGQSTEQLFASLVHQYAGIKLDPIVLGRAIQAVRRSGPYRGRPQNDDYWVEVNREGLYLCERRLSDKQALRIHREMEENPEHWEIPPSRIELIRGVVRLVGQGFVAIASNAPRDRVLVPVFERHGLLDLIPRELMFTPGVLGGVRKPAPQFFEEVAARLGVPPEEVLSVVNSPDSDLGCLEAGKDGMPTVMILGRSRKRYPDLRHPKLRVFRRSGRALGWILRHVRPASLRSDARKLRKGSERNQVAPRRRTKWKKRVD